MIIHEPELIKQDDQTIVFSRIEMRHPSVNFPESLWYRAPDRFSQYLSLQSDSFLIPGLLAGMHFQEDIEIRGKISPRLAYNLNEYQYLLNFRMPKSVSPVGIKYDQLKPLQVDQEGVGTTFSGGVDSLFTLWKHLPKNQPDPNFQITHALFILGFDILNADRQKYQSIYSGYYSALKQFNVELIPLETNLVSIIIPRMRYVHFYGPVLIGAAHVFGKLFHRFFIPNSRDYWQIKKRTSSSDPTTDPLLSTDTLEIIHHGAAYRRVEKIEAISDWEFAHHHLRVCQSSKPDESFVNCSRCEKCIRTMIPIYALGKMEKFKTFSKPINSDHQILWWARKFDPSKGYYDEMFSFTRKVKPNMIHWLHAAALLGLFRYTLLKLIPKSIRQFLMRFGYFMDPLMAETAFDDPVVTDLIRSKQI